MSLMCANHTAYIAERLKLPECLVDARVTRELEKNREHGKFHPAI